VNANTNTISIDGRLYDTVTGLPLTEHEQATRHHSSSHSHSDTPAAHLHSRPQRSSTLYRRATKRPVGGRRAITHNKPHAHTTTTSTHHQVKRFAPHPVGAVTPANTKRIMDIGPVAHPHVVKAHAKSLQKAQPQKHIPAPSIKEQAIKNAIDKTERKPPLKKRWLPQQKLVGVLSAVVALVLFGAYLTYLNMPNLSVRVAAVQAGIDASYPSYNPDGYSLSGPVTYSDGRVALNYDANGGPQHYTITQSSSDWNNDAVLDNYVTPRAGANYIPYSERGLVIYTYENNAAWVNGGILYTIEGDAPLSSEQIRRIATSLL
jgi:hypothetical protein